MISRLPPLRFGLSTRLFAILLLLGAIAVLISGGLGYISARDALERSIYNQLTAVRETKTHQVENYFRSTSDEIKLLANTAMVVEAMHDFRTAVDELDRTKVPDDVHNRVESWYDSHFMPMIRRQLGADAQVRDFLPKGSAPYLLQDRYIITNPNRTGQRRALADAGDGSVYSRLHAHHHPILRRAAATLNLYDLMMIDPRNGRIVYAHGSNGVVELDAATGKEIHTISIDGTGGWAGVEKLRNGHYLVARYGGNRVTEIDASGKQYWDVQVTTPGYATRLPNGNTLVCSIGGLFVVEYDRAGKEVWRQQTKGRPFRVHRR